jgi:hypothetical protein
VNRTVLKPFLNLAFGALLLASCNLATPAPTPTRAVNRNTPEGAALIHAASWAPDAQAATASFAPIHIWSLGRDSLVIYSFAGGYGEDWSVCNGQARVALEAGGWRVTEGGGRCWKKDGVEQDAITGLYSFVADDDGNMRTVIYGDVRLPDVTAVSIEFVVGGENAVAEIENAGYWLMRSGQQPPVRAIAIDAAGNLVQMLQFGRPLAPEPVDAPPTTIP